MRIVTVLKAGKDFNPHHAVWLAKQIAAFHPEAEFVCLTDTRIDHPEITEIYMPRPWAGFWSKMNLYNPELLPGDVFYLDLDSVVVGPIDDLVALDRSTGLRDFYHPRLLASGMLFIREEDKAPIYDAFVHQPAHWINVCRTRARWGDQGFLENFRDRFDHWQDVRPGRVCSYKVHCKRNGGKIPDGVSVVCFHGIPRPWDAAQSLDWVPPL